MNDSHQSFLTAEKQWSLKNEKFVLIQMPGLVESSSPLLSLERDYKSNNHDCSWLEYMNH